MPAETILQELVGAINERLYSWETPLVWETPLKYTEDNPLSLASLGERVLGFGGIAYDYCPRSCLADVEENRNDFFENYNLTMLKNELGVSFDYRNRVKRHEFDYEYARQLRDVLNLLTVKQIVNSSLESSSQYAFLKKIIDFECDTEAEAAAEYNRKTATSTRRQAPTAQSSWIDRASGRKYTFFYAYKEISPAVRTPCICRFRAKTVPASARHIYTPELIWPEISPAENQFSLIKTVPLPAGGTFLSGPDGIDPQWFTAENVYSCKMTAYECICDLAGNLEYHA